MYELICDRCKKTTSKLTQTKKGDMVCTDCKMADRPSAKLFLGIDCFPQDGIFLEHVSPQGHRFMSKGEMKEWEKKTGGMIGYLH